MNTKLLAAFAALFTMTGCEALSPFVGDELKSSVCDRDRDGLARISAYCAGTDCDDSQAIVGVLTWYLDEDQDGYGTAGGIVQCEPLAGYATRAGD